MADTTLKPEPRNRRRSGHGSGAMVKRCCAILALTIVFFVSGSRAAAGRLSLSGQASGWLFGGYDSLFVGEAGLRYIPTLSAELPVRGNATVGSEVSLHSGLNTRITGLDSAGIDWTFKPYRAWANFSLPRFEARVGLQKINFGSAMVLRPLQWFDRIDPRDPLEITDGVYGALCRYFFKNNANIWLWTLLGNEVPKGWEYIPTDRWSPEAGGRIQVPLPRGEIAVCGDLRRADIGQLVLPNTPGSTLPVAEDRVGFDGKWDLGIGVWVEGSFSRLSTTLVPAPYEQALTGGADYTFGIGSGLSVLAEHLIVRATARPLGAGAENQLSALTVSYPLGLIDQVRAIVLVDWNNKDLYRYLSWQRTYDAWIVSLSVFWNPSRPKAFTGLLPTGALANSGVQLLIVFNH